MLLYETLAILWLAHSIVCLPLSPTSSSKRDVNSNLVPSFGWEAGINPDGTGNCDGAVNGTNGKPILVPCQCPPNSTFFLSALNKNVAAGFVTTNPSVELTFPTDNSTASQLARLNAAAATLQNLEGLGIGCPISSTTFTTQHKVIAAEVSGVPSSSTPAVSSSSVTSGLSTSANTTGSTGSCSVKTLPTAASAQTPSFAPSNSSATDATGVTPSSGNATIPTDAQIAALSPLLGWQSGINPDGAGNCDGAINGTNGRPIRIPCQCPPDEAHYISVSTLSSGILPLRPLTLSIRHNLTANIRAGHVVLNPSVFLTFPMDNSAASQSARLNAAAVTIQNLNGAGKGCPISSTNFTAQSKAIKAERLG